MRSSPNRVVFVVLLAVLLAPLAAAADEAASPFPVNDTALYVRALELAIGGDTIGAEAALRDLLERFPASAYAERAQTYLSAWGSRVDRSGIVPFSILNLVTATALTVTIPLAFEIENTLVLSLSGLAGVGVGLGGSWLLARDIDLSWGQELWMDVAQAVSLVDYLFAWLIVSDTLPSEVQRFVPLGAALTATLARGLAYAAVGRGGALPAGRPSFIGISYATAFAYAMLTMRGVIHGMGDDLYRGLMIGIPTAAAVGSYFLWDVLDWRAERSGFMAPGSLGGALAGFFVSGILDYALGGIDSQLTSGIILAGAVAGQATAIALTARMSDEGAPTVAQRGDGSTSPGSPAPLAAQGAGETASR
jgi:hypothetical protein